jgi:hypothetical protein
MELKTMDLYLTHIILIELLIIANLIVIEVFWGVQEAFHPSPEVIYYFQNCNNLTIFPDGCQVLS